MQGPPYGLNLSSNLNPRARGGVLKLSREDSQFAFEDDYPGEARLEAGRHVWSNR